MTPLRRWTAVLIGVAMAGAVAACGTDSGGGPTSGCTDETRSAGEPGDAVPLLSFGALRHAPTIVYSDGAVVIPISDTATSGGSYAAGFLRVPMMMPGYHGDQPGGFTGGWLSDCELDAVIERADDLFTPDVDFGDPMVTDSGSTSVSYDGQTELVYAFNRDNPVEWGDLSRAQAGARQDLADLWTLVESSAELTGELETDRLFLHVYGPISDDEATEWPLETPISEVFAAGCVTVSDPVQVEAMLDRLDDSPILEESPWRLAVVAAAPGIPDCD